MANFKYTSWGNTRQPKNIINSNHDTPASVTLAAGAATSAEYITENQRFLHISHVVTTGDGNGEASIQLQIYSYATNVWVNFSSAIASRTDRRYQIVEIFGVDKVRFVATGLTGTEKCTIFPACSTF